MEIFAECDQASSQLFFAAAQLRHENRPRVEVDLMFTEIVGTLAESAEHGKFPFGEGFDGIIVEVHCKIKFPEQFRIFHTRFHRSGGVSLNGLRQGGIKETPAAGVDKVAPMLKGGGVVDDTPS